MTRRLKSILRQPALHWFAAAALTYVGIAISGVLIASMASDVRARFVALEQNQRAQDDLLAQYSRLLIERATLSSYRNVDEVAARQLAMRFPEIVERVSP
ncbi:MAG TPA: cell division protein FtsL [Pseudomonadales bacterium]